MKTPLCLQVSLIPTADFFFNANIWDRALVSNFSATTVTLCRCDTTGWAFSKAAWVQIIATRAGTPILVLIYFTDDCNLTVVYCLASSETEMLMHCWVKADVGE